MSLKVLLLFVVFVAIQEEFVQGEPWRHGHRLSQKFHRHRSSFVGRLYYRRPGRFFRRHPHFYHRRQRALRYRITRTWDSKEVSHSPIRIQLTHRPRSDYLTATFSGPFFNDPAAPNGTVGQPFPGLWNFEVAEIFFLNSKNDKYLEVEVSPHGQHLVLLLNGTRNLLDYKLPLKYRSRINKYTSTWRGVAQIPLSYIPRGVDRMNAYAIHGSGDARVFQALYPVPTGKFENPDFHRLDYFRRFNIRRLVRRSGFKKIGKFWERYYKDNVHSVKH